MKKCYIVALCLLLILTMAACVKTEEQTPEKTEPETQAPTVTEAQTEPTAGETTADPNRWESDIDISG